MAIIGITGMGGAQGAAIAAAAFEAGHTVRRVSRTEGGYTNPSALTHHLEGLDALIVTSPVDHQAGVRQHLMQTIVTAAHQAQVKRMVFNTAAAIHPGSNQPIARNLAELKDIVQSGKTPTIVVEPTVYLDNLAAPWALAAIKQGVLPYPAPRGARVSWLSHKTLAQCAIAAATLQTLPTSATLHIGGAKAMTGDELAQTIGQVLGHTVQYDETPLSEFASMLNSVAGAPAGDDIADYYRHLQDHPNALARDSHDMALLRVQAETVESWLNRVL